MKNKTNISISIFSITVFCLFGFLFLLQPIQNYLIQIGGLILGRTLNTPDLWIIRITKCSICLFYCSFLLIIHTLNIKYNILENPHVRNFLKYLVILAFSFFTTSLFDIFIFEPNSIGTDSSVFLYIGKNMHNGMIPYKDMFDHKGPILYFLEFIGTFFNSYKGIFLIQYVSIFITYLFSIALASFITQNNIIKYFVSFIVIYFFGRAVYEGGNLTELYALPCVTYSLYIVIKYLYENRYTQKEFIFVGISFTIVLLLRVNMVAPWVYFVLYYIIKLIHQKLYKDLYIMIRSFLIGFIIIILPTFIYLYITNSITDMINSYIIFNFTYISDKGGIKNNLLVLYYFIKIFALPFICIFISIIKKFNNEVIYTNYISFFVTLFFTIISGQYFPHYGIILLPFFVMPISYTVNILWKFIFKSKISSTFNNIFISTFIILIFISIPNEKFSNKNQINEDSIQYYLTNQINSDYDLLVLGNKVYYNLIANSYTQQRFFFQLPVVLQNKIFLSEFIESFNRRLPDYVILPSDSYEIFMKDDFNEITQTLKSKYKKIIFVDGELYELIN